MDEDEDIFDGEEDWCDCDDYDADLLEGRAHCFRCGRSWWMSNEEMSKEIRWQAEMIISAEECEISGSPASDDIPFAPEFR